MNLKYVFLALVLVSSLPSCSTYRFDDDNFGPPCERNRTGEVCFENFTNRKIRMEIGDHRFDLWKNTTLCLDLYEDFYDFKGKQGLHRWRGSIEVYSCEQYYIDLDR